MHRAGPNAGTLVLSVLLNTLDPEKEVQYRSPAVKHNGQPAPLFHHWEMRLK